MEITRKKIFNLILIFLALFILYYSMSIVIYIIISLIIALMLSPVNQMLRKVQYRGYGLKSTLPALLTMSLLISFLVLVVNVFVPVVSKEVSRLSNVNMDEFYELIEPEVKSISGVLQKIQQNPHAETNNEREVLKSFLLGKKNVDRVPQFFTGLASGVGGSIIAIFSVFFITFFLLRDDNLFNEFVYSFGAKKNNDRVKYVLDKVKRTLSRYFIGIFIQVSVITFFVSVGLTLFGFKNALVIGLFAGIMNVIPYVGPLIGLGFGILIGISTNVDMASIGTIYTVLGEILLVFGVTQLVDNFITQPVVFSKSINAHPLEIFLVILLAGNVWGIPGMIIAIPFYSVIRIIAKEYYSDSRFVRFMTQTMK